MSEIFGLPNNISINYGQPGFPPWVYELCRRFGLRASTYPFHQSNERPNIGAAPNPQGLNRGIDWVGSPQAMLDFAHWLRDTHPPGVEMVIYQDPRNGERVGFPTWVNYNDDYPGHTDHVHTRMSANPIEGEFEHMLDPIDVLARASGLSYDRAKVLLPIIRDGLLASNCTTPKRIGMWLGQIGHESDSFRATEEYAKGDGGATDRWRYLGRTWIQITWRENYAAFSDWCFKRQLVPTPTYFVDNPAVLAEPRWAALGPAWYWTVARPGINQMCDNGDIAGVTQAIQGADGGLEDRRLRYRRALALGDDLLILIKPGVAAKRGLDYSAGRPGAAAIKDAGYQFVVRYLTAGGAEHPGKLLTPEEADDLRSHGIEIVSNFETYADRMKEGYSAGVEDAKRALAQVLACGGRRDRPIYFSADWDTTEADQAPVDDYLRGAGTVIGPENVGIYGGYWSVSRALDAGVAKWGWQTHAWSHLKADESDLRIDRRIQLEQLPPKDQVSVNGVVCDVNLSHAEDYGQWSIPAKTAPTQTGKEDMFDEDAKEKLNRIYDELTKRFVSRSPFRPLGQAGESPLDTGFGFELMEDANVHILLMEKLASYGDPDALNRLDEIARADPAAHPSRANDIKLAQLILKAISSDGGPRTVKKAAAKKSAAKKGTAQKDPG